MGVLVEDLLALARLDEMPAGRARAGRPRAARARRRRRRARGRARPRGRHVTRGRHRRQRRPRAAAPGARQPDAQRAHPHAGGNADRALARRARDGDVRIEVRDHGPGLPAGAEASVFERFWRAEGGRERGKAGAGLGLAIVAAIVDAHGGRVSARNAPGGGGASSSSSCPPRGWAPRALRAAHRVALTRRADGDQLGAQPSARAAITAGAPNATRHSRQRDRAILPLVILEQRDDRATDGDRGPVERVRGLRPSARPPDARGSRGVAPGSRSYSSTTSARGSAAGSAATPRSRTSSPPRRRGRRPRC